MKKLFFIVALFISVTASAQVTKVSLRASGLTCSMCSNSITKALKTLPFVAAVTPDIKNSSFELTVTPGSRVNFDEIRKKVEGAGFAISAMNATLHFRDQHIVNDEHITAGGLTLHFINVKSQMLSGDKTIQILDKGFVSPKAFSKNAVYTKMECYKTGVTGMGCTHSGLTAGTRIYHVTI